MNTNHLKPGIKTGPSLDDTTRLTESGAKYTEVWYRPDQPEKYVTLFNHIKEHGIYTGLHFWGMLEDSIMPNIAYPDPKIIAATLHLMKQNIDDAAKHGFYYVNIHIGNAILQKIDFEHNTMTGLPDTLVDMARAEDIARRNMIELNGYAKSSGVQLIVETVPIMEPQNRPDHLAHKPTTIAHTLSNVFLENMAREHGIAINNDISHTASEFITSDRTKLWGYVLARTQALAPFTKLSHINTMIEPFNGTDTHDGIRDKDFALNIFPTKSQLIELLRVYNDAANANGKDIWILCEPQDDHVGNYHALCELLANIT